MVRRSVEGFCEFDQRGELLCLRGPRIGSLTSVSFAIAHHQLVGAVSRRPEQLPATASVEPREAAGICGICAGVRAMFGDSLAFAPGSA